MTTSTYLLIGLVCSAVVLAEAPAQAGGGIRVGSHHHFKRFHRHHVHHGFYRHRRHRGSRRYSDHRGSYRLGYREYGPPGRPAPPYSGSIEGEQAKLYRSGPKVYVHFGANAPMWSEAHVLRHPDAPQTMLHIVIVLPSGEVSIDRRDLGHVGKWPQGQMQLAMLPGRYTVHLRRDGSVYSRQVQVYEGMATIVKAGLR